MIDYNTAHARKVVLREVERAFGPVLEAQAAEIARLRLTDAEREAVEAAVVVMAGTVDRRVIDTLRAMVSRLS